jgi:hypothetical protein
MTQVKWLLEPEVFQYESKPIIEALERRGIEHKVCEFGKTYEDVVKVFDPDDCVVVHGSLQLGRAVQKRTRWIPGAYCNLPRFECLYYYPRFGEHLLNYDYAMFPLGALKDRGDWLEYHFGVNGCVFLRPSSGFKTFTGRVVEFCEWDRELRDLSFRLDPETLVLVCQPIEVVKEWRLVVTDRVIAYSQYKEGKGLVRLTGSDLLKVRETPQEVLDYGQQVLSEVRFNPDPIWTLDICETAGGELKVLEVGSFSCAGLYACDPEPIIDEVNKLALKEWEECQ